MKLIHGFLLYFICALTFIFSKAASLEFNFYDQFIFLFYKFVIGFIFSGIIFFVYSLCFNNNVVIDKKNNFFVLFLSSLLFIISVIFDLISTYFGNISYISFLYNFMPFVTFLLEIFLNKKFPSLRIFFHFMVAFGFSFLGLYIAFLRNMHFEICCFDNNVTLFVCCSILFSSLAWVLRARYLTLTTKNILSMQCLDMLVGSILIYLINVVFLSQNFYTLFCTNLLNNILFLKWAFIGSLFSYVFFNLYYIFLLRFFSPTFLSFIGSITPFLVSLFSVLFFNELILWKSFIMGFLNSLIGSLLYKKLVDKI